MPEPRYPYVLVINMPGYLPEAEPVPVQSTIDASIAFEEAYSDLPRIKQLARKLRDHGYVYFTDSGTDYVAEVLPNEDN